MGLRGAAVAALVLLAPSAVSAAEYGNLAQPAFDLGDAVRLPLSAWCPQPGDVLFSGPSRPGGYLVSVLTRQPAHVGLVVLLPDGRPAVAEAGGDGVRTTRVTPLDQRFSQYRGPVWVRRRSCPLTDDQSCRLTQFALSADGGGYSLARGIGMGARLGARGPLRTAFLGRPQGCRDRYFCGEFVIEALVCAGVLDPNTARPSAVFPRDLFFDSSMNPFLRSHPPLGCGWEPPARWVGCWCGE